MAGHLSIGKLITFQLYWNQIQSGYQTVMQVLMSLTRAAGAAQRVLSLVDALVSGLLTSSVASVADRPSAGMAWTCETRRAGATQSLAIDLFFWDKNAEGLRLFLLLQVHLDDALQCSEKQGEDRWQGLGFSFSATFRPKRAFRFSYAVVFSPDRGLFFQRIA